MTERMFEQHVLPKLGNKPVVDLRRADIIELLDDLQHKKGLGAQVNRIHAALKAALNFAVEREYLDANPAAAVKKQFRGEVPRERVLSDDELRAIWQAADALKEPSRGLVKMMILTGQRRDEVRCLPWAELDLDSNLWTLAASRNKGKREHVVPLSDEAKAVLAALPKLGEEFVFTTGGKRPYAGQKRLKDILDRESKVTDWTFHDIRRTVASGLASLRISHDVIGRVLNHAKTDVTARHYNRHDYLEEKSAALTAWGRHVAALVSDTAEGGTVVALKVRQKGSQ
ncbi:tyrosine-type recombinase/integrase [Magnetospirillum sp. UT-4]|uniref:tyrosine-type recombinase/integrase n=1 Tax=Magnetospirillum sp. UT-4 TaxID=2681467 RepID=UPI00352EFA34